MVAVCLTLDECCFPKAKEGKVYLRIAVGFLSLGVIALAQVDPGVRSGAPGAGGPVPGLTTQQLSAFTAAKLVFNEVDSVSGTVPGEGGSGLGPSFNLNSCVGCHKHPADGGSSPAIGATNTVHNGCQRAGAVKFVRV